MIFFNCERFVTSFKEQKMVLKAKTEHESKSKQAMKTMLKKFNDFETQYPDEFKEFLSDPTVKRQFTLINSYSQ